MEKISLPIKTKIAAWWMMAVGIFMILPAIFCFYVFLFGLSTAASPKDLKAFLIGVIAFFISLMLFISGVLILKRKNLGWWIATIISGLASTLLFILWFFSLGIRIISTLQIRIAFLVFFIPLILLLLDRKNFWKIAT